jgi:hypothetical protein
MANLPHTVSICVKCVVATKREMMANYWEVFSIIL